MTIWAIADIHASRRDPTTGMPNKPMDVFGDEWRDHVNKLEHAWQECVTDADTVVIAGDIDWALKLENAVDTLERISSWAGQKVLLRGNHDYWWSSKTTSKVRRVLPPSLRLLHNDSVQVDGFNICGCKGSPVQGGMDWTAENAKLLNREEQRLRISLQSRDSSLPTIIAFHYPPFYPGTGTSPFRDIIDDAEAGLVVYGHLHGKAAVSGPVGRFGRTFYRLVACDAIDFRPALVAADGQVKEE
ncbi:MAG: metallophosphoesterase [Chloroflexota bacterium]